MNTFRTPQKPLGLTSIALVCVIGVSWAQKGSAPSGFYPSHFHGNTFSGKVTKTSGDQLTLQYEHGSKRETFEGKIESVCMAATKKGDIKPLELKAIPIGTILTVFYNPESSTGAGVKEVSNLILGIRFDTVNGHELTDPGRPVIPCMRPGAAPTSVYDDAGRD